MKLDQPERMSKFSKVLFFKAKCLYPLSFSLRIWKSKRNKSTGKTYLLLPKIIEW